MKKIRHQKKIKAKNLAIDKKLFIRRKGESENDLAYRIRQQLKIFDFYNAVGLIHELGSSVRPPVNLTNIFEQSNYYEHVQISGSISPRNHVYWLLGLLKANVGLITKFNSLRYRLSSKILKGNAAEALAVVGDIDQLCKSWWAAEIRLHIIKELQKGETKELLQELNKSFNGVSVEGWTFDLSLISESSSIDVYVNVISSRLEEIRSSGLEDAIADGAVTSCNSLPISYDTQRRLSLFSSYANRHESLIDQYMTLRAVFSEMHLGGQSIPEDVLDIFLSLAESAGDAETLNVFRPNTVPSDFVGSVLSEYTEGNYDEVIKRVKESIQDENSESLGLVEVYARSIAYASSLTPFKPVTFFDSLALELSLILQLAPKSMEKISYLKKICVKFRTERWAKSLIFHTQKILEEIEQTDAVEASRLQTSCLGSLNTPKANYKNYKPSITDLASAGTISSCRLKRYASSSDISIPLDKTIFHIHSDYLVAQSCHFLERGELFKAINFSIEEYLQNKTSFLFLPISNLCNYAAETTPESNQESLSCLILLDIYSREIDSKHNELRSELFEDFLANNNTHQPSTLFSTKSKDPYSTYFLRNICTPSALDNITAFKSYDEVIHERVAILDTLITGRVIGNDELNREKDNVLENLFAEKLRAKIESGKLFVDTQALEEQRKHIYVSFFEQAKTLEGGIGLDLIDSNDSSLTSKDIFEISKDETGMPHAVASSEKTDLLFKIFTTAASDFALNENYGLDKYLSAEVRHTVFLTQLRSCFEKTMLLTTKKDGEYQTNEHWKTQYNYVNPAIIERIDEVLKVYSKEIDEILTSINNRFRVAVARESNENIFDFKAYHHRLVDVSKILNGSSTFEAFFKSLIKYMWSLAGDSAKNAQKLINEELKNKVLERTLSLEQEVSLAKGDVAMVSLMQEIKNTRSNFIKEVELVLNWFRFIGAEDLGDLERLGVVIEASVSSFESIYGHKDRILEFTQSKTSLLLTYREARSLFISLFTALDNAFNYSDHSCPVRLSHVSSDNQDLIIIENQPASPFESPQEFAESQRQKWTKENSNLNIDEGGSGLYKIYSLLTTASAGFEYDISVKSDQFTTIIGLSHESFSNRG
ncbi:MAG: hypothetical protein CMK99_08120 [Pseudomonas sp.]|nr:hypothetical protein [Pseudomonas sp.]|tara:strand:+ start:11897 stop:15223 length:3327 start_codon:yes stop_codon:yes gene_type:complete